MGLGKAALTRAARNRVTRKQRVDADKETKRQSNIAKDQTDKSLTKTEQADAGMGTASKSRVQRSEASAKAAGAKKEYERTLKMLDNAEGLSDEQMERMMNKLSEMEDKYGFKPSDFNKGGMAKKRKAAKGKKVPVVAVAIGMGKMKRPQMMKGGMANGKSHMYAGGGSVTDNLTPAQKNMVRKMAAANVKK